MLSRCGFTRAEKSPPLRIVLIFLPSIRNTTLAIPTPRTRALNERAAQPLAARSRALTLPMRSPRTSCSGFAPWPDSGETAWLGSAGGLFELVSVGGITTGGGGSHASPRPAPPGSFLSAFGIVGEVLQGAARPSPAPSGGLSV